MKTFYLLCTYEFSWSVFQNKFQLEDLVVLNLHISPNRGFLMSTIEKLRVVILIVGHSKYEWKMSKITRDEEKPEFYFYYFLFE